MKTGKLTAGSLELIDASVSFTNVGGVITFTDGDYPSGITISEIITADTDHNLLINLQGGEDDGYYHLTPAQHTWFLDGYNAGYWDVDKGGTGLTSYAEGDMLYADAAGNLVKLTIGSDNQVLVVNGNVPNWETSSVIITNHNLLDGLEGGDGIDGYYHLTQYEHTWLTDGYIAGHWDTDKGGTGITSYVTGDILYASNTDVLSTLSAGTNGTILTLAGGVPVWDFLEHNTLLNIQGGDGIDGYYHLTQYEHTWLTDGYNNGHWDTDKGGTGITSYVTGDILYASNTDVLSALTIGSAGDVLTVTGGVPTWEAPTGGSSLFDEIITRADDLTDANWTPIDAVYTMDGYTGYFFKVCAVVFGTLQGAMGEWDFGVNVRSDDLLDGYCSVFMGENTSLQESIMSTITAADGDHLGATVGFEIKAVLNDYEITWEAKATEYVATTFHVRLKIGIIKQAM